MLLERATRSQRSVRWPVVIGAPGLAAVLLAAVAVPSLLRARMASELPEPAAHRTGLIYEPHELLLPPPPPPAGVDGGVVGGVEGGVPGGVVGGVVGGLPGAPQEMFFEHRGTNPFVATEQDALSTFGLDVEHASYTLARSY